MARSRPRKTATSTDIKSRLAKAALTLLEKHGWASLNLEQIAKAANLPFAQAQQAFADKNDILVFMIHDHDAASLSALAQTGADSPVHDRLFEALMARFDQLQHNRGAYLNLLQECRRQPALAARLGQALFASMQAVIARIDNALSGCKQRLASAGLLAIYLKALYAWQQDQSDDLAKTMAMLDRSLRRGSKIAEMIFRAL